MSHRAIVAAETSSGIYDIYFSANGADSLYLTDLLKKHFVGQTNDPLALANATAKRPFNHKKWCEASESNPDIDCTPVNAAKPAIDPDPMSIELPLEKVAYPVDFDNIEAFYLVRNGTLETYVPIWMEPNIIRPWRDHLTVEVYRSRQLSDSSGVLWEEIDSIDPIRVIDEKTFSSKEWLDDTIVRDVVTEFHEYVYTVQRMLAESEDIPDSERVPGFLDVPPYHLHIKGPTDKAITPPSTGRGLLIQIPNKNMSKYHYVIDNANIARLETGVHLNSSPTISKDDLEQQLIKLSSSIIDDHIDNIAPFSPPPFNQVQKRLTSSTA